MANVAYHRECHQCKLDLAFIQEVAIETSRYVTF